jgi:Ca2+-transporting ATPase
VGPRSAGTAEAAAAKAGDVAQQCASPALAPGLSEAEASVRARRDGPNALPQGEGRGGGRILLEVLREPMLLLLLAAAGVYLMLGDAFDAAALGASALFVVGLSFWQQRRAENALRALREMASPRCYVSRDGEWQRRPASDLVVDDLIELREGDRVPADAQLVAGAALTLDESLLTGESAPVRRSSGDADVEQHRVLAGTLVTAGRAQARVHATGARSELGRIGYALRATRAQPTPTQREMRRAVLLFTVIGFASCLAVTLLYLDVHGDWLQGLLAGITLAVANVPEEFPLILTVFLAIGAWRLAKAQALVRRPPAIEALGAVTVLCSDKTGTLTVNRMTVAELACEGAGLRPSPGMPPRYEALLDAAFLASQPLPHDPMERAIAALHAGPAAPRELLHSYPIEDALLAYGQVWRGAGGALEVACKGAPEAIVELCALDPAERERVLGQTQAMARRGLRVLGVGAGAWQGEREQLPATLRGVPLAWRGLVGFADPLRPGAHDAVAEAQLAGIRVVMLTGDHPETARAIAREAGLPRWQRVELGADLQELSAEALAQHAQDVDVFARVRPEHKLRLVKALRSRGERVAMTGDGVNDAPALATADIGVAMGQRGTDVAREAAGIVLLDDDFSTVVRAIRLGRSIYENLRRAVCFVVAVHVPITGMALLPLLLGAPIVLLPLHVVFLELIVDPACSIVLEREPAPADLMRRPPRPARQHLLDVRLLAAGLAQGGVVMLAVAGVYLVGAAQPLSTATLAATTFVSLVAGNIGLIALNRTPRRQRPAAQPPNLAFLVLALGAAGLLLAVTGFAPAANLLGFTTLSPGLLAAAVAPPLVVAWLMAVGRSLARRMRPARRAIAAPLGAGRPAGNPAAQPPH